MGSVKQLTTTGDNDVSLYPQKYYRHYMYCDRCGSFEIIAWFEPENHESLQIKEKWLRKISDYFWFGSGYFLIVTLVIGLVYFIITQGFENPLLFVAIFGIMFVGFLIFFGLAEWIGSKVHQMGVKCAQCSEKYKNGSIFFTNMDRNSRNYTIKDVPTPLYVNYLIEGATIHE